MDSVAQAVERIGRSEPATTSGTLVPSCRYVLIDPSRVATLGCMNQRPVGMSRDIRTSEATERDVKLAWLFFAGTFVVLVLNGVWSVFMGTASMGGDESDLVQGWAGVLRNSPAYLLLIIVALLGVWFATAAGARGSARANAALIATSLALLLALASVTRDVAEVVMTTRAATVAWIAFVADVVLVGLVHVAARRRIKQGRLDGA